MADRIQAARQELARRELARRGKSIEAETMPAEQPSFPEWGMKHPNLFGVAEAAKAVFKPALEKESLPIKIASTIMQPTIGLPDGIKAPNPFMAGMPQPFTPPMAGREETAGMLSTQSSPGAMALMGLPYVGKTKQVAGLFREAITPIKSIATKTIPKTAAIGQKGLSIFKQGRDYLYEKVAKPAADAVNKSLKTFPDFAKNLGVKKETVGLLRQHGYDKVANVEQAEELAKQAFNAATSQKSIVYGNRINISDTLARAKRYYNATKATNPNSPLKGLIERLEALQPAKKGFYVGTGKENLPTPTQLERLFKGEKLSDIAGEVRITREQLSDIRQQLSNLYKKEGFDKVKAYKLIDSLYTDAEKSGLKGIQNARKLFSEYKQFEGVAKDIVKVEKIDANKILNDLNTVSNDPTKYKAMIDKYSNYTDRATAEKIFKEALSVRRGGKIVKRAGYGTAVGLAGKGALDIFR